MIDGMKDGFSYDCPNCGAEFVRQCIREEGQDMYLVIYKCPNSNLDCTVDELRVWEEKGMVPAGTEIHWKLLVHRAAVESLRKHEEEIRKDTMQHK